MFQKLFTARVFFIYVHCLLRRYFTLLIVVLKVSKIKYHVMDAKQMMGMRVPHSQKLIMCMPEASQKNDKILTLFHS